MGKDIYVTRTPIDKSGGSAWDYLQKLAAETGLQTEEAENILSKQYELVDVKRDNVPLAQYLGDKTQLTVLRTPKQIYYPFGCNVSQKKAVEAALTHQVSINSRSSGNRKDSDDIEYHFQSVDGWQNCTLSYQTTTQQ